MVENCSNNNYLEEKVRKLENSLTTLQHEYKLIQELSDSFMEKLYSIMNNSSETIIAFLYSDFTIEHANIGFKKIFNIKEDDFKNSTHKKNMENLKKLTSKILAYEKGYSGEIVFHDMKNNPLNIKFHISRILSPIQEKREYIFFGYDITNISQMQLSLEKSNKKLLLHNKKIKEANRYKSEFLNNITHELRTPLSGILGILKLIDRLNPTDEKLLNYLSMIKNNTSSQLEVINQLLDISRIEAGKMSINHSKIPVLYFVQEAENLINSLLVNKPQIKFIKELDIDKEQIIFDISKIRNILNNLLGNAVKFTEEGYIKLRVVIKKNIFSIEVEDSGIGISIEDQKKIFQPFVQADGSITKKYGGTGLGLTIIYKIVNLLEGQIKLLSKKNKGSRFTIIFNLDKY